MNVGQDAGTSPGVPFASQGGIRVLVDCAAVSHTPPSGVDVHAVRGVNCRIEAGMRVAVTGPRGSGTSTLLHLLAGLATPTEGRVSWPALGDTPCGRAGTVGMVFPGPSLVPGLDAATNVALPLLVAGIPRDEATGRAAAALHRLELGALAPRSPDRLSVGQAQQVAIARILATRPALVLADEPTAQLDRHATDRVIALLLHTADELGAALVMATHDPAVAVRLPRQWRMEDGRLAVDGLPSAEDQR